jgi:pyruvate/2-oxoglutarate dehydrogenase complex dihydrolipoamide dehydrogenase (E3) component
VIGGGRGRYAAALYALAGPRIAVVERDKVGGVFLHRGCIPAKQFLETASVARTVAGAKDFGVQAGQPLVDFAVSQRRKQEVVGQLYKGRVGLMMRDECQHPPGRACAARGCPPQPIAASTSAEPTCVWPVQGPPARPPVERAFAW